MKLSKRSIKLIAFHLGLVAIAGNGILVLFLKLVLPIITCQGQFITVPDLKGASLKEAEAVLTSCNLRFEVTEESAYEPAYLPMVVLQQNPQAGGQVKAGRKIYLTLNASSPPQVKMPDLVDGSVRNAHVLLKSHGLLLGTIQYVPDLAQDAVLEQWLQGNKIAPGSWVAKGSKIDLVVGAGLEMNPIETPQLIGMTLADAQFLLLSAGLKVGNTNYEAIANLEPGTVMYQAPFGGTPILIGESVDLWIVAPAEETTKTPEASILPGCD